MTVWLIGLLCFLALWHFIVEAIIVPSERATIRLRLFAVRDKLRNMAADKLTNEYEFEEAQSKLNNLIRLAPSIDAFLISKWTAKLKTDKELAQRIEKRQTEFESKASKEVKDLISDAIKIGTDAVRINSLSWIIYLVPIIFGLLAISWIHKEVVDMTNATEHELPLSPACPT